MYTKKETTFPSPFTFFHTKVAPLLTYFVIYPLCFLTAYMVMSRPSCLAWALDKKKLDYLALLRRASFLTTIYVLYFSHHYAYHYKLHFLMPFSQNMQVLWGDSNPPRQSHATYEASALLPSRGGLEVEVEVEMEGYLFYKKR